MVLVDANVLLDLLTAPNDWADWSADQLRRVAAEGPLLANDVIFAEVSINFRHLAEVEAVFAEAGVALAPLPRPALFRAGKAFREYRRRGGLRTGVLPDFFIGAHAEVAGLRLLTRDAARYRSYFPGVPLIAPG
jgi:predicted nucleic acid-binding protein